MYIIWASLFDFTIHYYSRLDDMRAGYTAGDGRAWPGGGPLQDDNDNDDDDDDGATFVNNLLHQMALMGDTEKRPPSARGHERP